MSLEDLISEDLPEKARKLIAAADRAAAKARGAAEERAAEIRERAEQEARALLDAAEEEARKRYEALTEKLKPLQAEALREGDLDGALAIRAKVRSLRGAAMGAEPAPPFLPCRPQDAGKSFLYEVTGDLEGPVWGTDVYTGDSRLAAAAVHAGLLRPGERGVVRFTVIDTRGRGDFEGSTRNGVTSEDWDEWDTGFRVTRP